MHAHIHACTYRYKYNKLYSSLYGLFLFQESGEIIDTDSTISRHTQTTPEHQSMETQTRHSPPRTIATQTENYMTSFINELEMKYDAPAPPTPPPPTLTGRRKRNANSPSPSSPQKILCVFPSPHRSAHPSPSTPQPPQTYIPAAGPPVAAAPPSSSSASSAPPPSYEDISVPSSPLPADPPISAENDMILTQAIASINNGVFPFEQCLLDTFEETVHSIQTTTATKPMPNQQINQINTEVDDDVPPSSVGGVNTIREVRLEAGMRLKDKRSRIYHTEKSKRLMNNGCCSLCADVMPSESRLRRQRCIVYIPNFFIVIIVFVGIRIVTTNVIISSRTRIVQQR